MTRRVTTYGLDAAADISATDIVLGPLDVRGSVIRRGAAGAGQVLGPVALNVPGRHNLQNALAAVAVGLELGLPFERIVAGLAEFRGVERRFDVRGEPNGILVVDDYGHHPTEIAAVLAAAKPLGRRIIVAFQPHRYTRTAAQLHAFGPALAGADHIVLTDIYSAGEDPIEGVTIDALAEAVRRDAGRPVDIARRVEDVTPLLARLARPGDVVLTLGAGSIGSVAAKLIDALEKSKGVQA
jgi:UDP-N-acetylmuramate--alanine ligase